MSRSPLFMAALVLLCGLAVSGGLAVHHSSLLLDRGLHEHGVPYVGNNDGYYHLDRASRLAEEGRSPLGFVSDSGRSMLLPYLLSSVAGDRDDLHLLAAYLGPIMGLSMLLAVLPWAAESRSRFVMLAAPLLALAAPYWVTRTHVGFLDTDSLVPAVCLLSLYCLRRFAAGGLRPLWLGGYLLSALFLWFWWQPGAYVCVGFLVCYLAYPARTRTDSALKVGLALALVVGVVLALMGVAPLAGMAGYVAKHFGLAFGGADGSLMSRAIIELKGVGVVGMGEKSLGSAWLLPVAAVGSVAYAVRRKGDAVFLLSGWVFAVAGVFSQRFIPLFVPVGAFFTVYGVPFCARGAAGLVGDREVVRAAILAVSLPLLFWGAVDSLRAYEPESYFTREDHELAATVRDSFPEDTVIWTWWDFGYFFRYLTGMDTYFDGGSQTERTCFVAAYPLMQPDMDVAAAWMRHFAGSGPKGFSVAEQGAGWPEYLGRFTRGLRESRTGSGSVALVLPARVYTTTGYLYAFAHVFDETVPGVTNHLDLFPATGFRFDPGSQSVVVPQVVVDKGYDSFGGVIDATGADPDGVDFASIPDPYLVFSRDAEFLAVTDRLLVKSVLFRLLGLFPHDARPFETVAFGYRSGGVWRVR